MPKTTLREKGLMREKATLLPQKNLKKKKKKCLA